MGELLQIKRNLAESYSHINVFKSVGNPGFCGWGVRTRDDTTPVGNTYFCTAYPIPSASTISKVNFHTALAAPGDTIEVSIWKYIAGDTVYTLVGSETVPEPAAGWANDTIYLIDLDSSIYTPPGAADAYFYLAVYSAAVTFQSTDNLPVVRGTVHVGNAATSPSIPLPANMNTAISIEAWGEPISWEQDMVGGAILDYNEDWWGTELSPGGGWNNITNIESLGGPSASVSVGGNGAILSIDLGNGFIPTAEWDHEIFPDYTTMGLRAVAEVHINGKLPDPTGSVAVLFSNIDDNSTPALGNWANLYEITDSDCDPVSREYDVRVYLPFVGRWIRFLETGPRIDDEIWLVEITYVTVAVTDGEFGVNHAQGYHGVWVDTDPASDELYYAVGKNLQEQTSYASQQFTNRMNKD